LNALALNDAHQAVLTKCEINPPIPKLFNSSVKILLPC